MTGARAFIRNQSATAQTATVGAIWNRSFWSCVKRSINGCIVGMYPFSQDFTSSMPSLRSQYRSLASPPLAGFNNKAGHADSQGQCFALAERGSDVEGALLGRIYGLAQ